MRSCNGHFWQWKWTSLALRQIWFNSVESCTGSTGFRQGLLRVIWHARETLASQTGLGVLVCWRLRPGRVLCRRRGSAEWRTRGAWLAPGRARRLGGIAQGSLGRGGPPRTPRCALLPHCPSWCRGYRTQKTFLSLYRWHALRASGTEMQRRWQAKPRTQQAERRAGGVTPAATAREFRRTSADISPCINYVQEQNIAAFVCAVSAKKGLCLAVR